MFEGSLPQDLTLNTTTGVIKGTPTQAETQLFRIKIEDSSIATHTGAPQRIIAPGYPRTVYDFAIDP